MKAETKFDVEYKPGDDEPFMNPEQLEYFRRKLLAWKASILAESRGTIEHMQEGTRNIPDVADRASEETDRALKLRTRDRERKVVSKIDAALRLLPETFGQPHLHAGLGIRRLKGSYFEFRVGRDMRVVFQLEGSRATLRMVVPLKDWVVRAVRMYLSRIFTTYSLPA